MYVYLKIKRSDLMLCSYHANINSKKKKKKNMNERFTS